MKKTSATSWQKLIMTTKEIKELSMIPEGMRGSIFVGISRQI
jgi:hypothetical protein